MKLNYKLLGITLSLLLLFSTGFSFAAEKVYKLKFTHHMPETSFAHNEVMVPYCKSIEKATNGRVQITVYVGQSLCKAFDAWDCVKAGVADMGLFSHGFAPGQYPVTDVMSLPMLPFKTSADQAVALCDLYDKYPEVRKEFEDVHIAVFMICGPYFTASTKDKGRIYSPDDFKGMKLRALGGPPTTTTKLLGGEPMLIPAGEVFSSLDKGILDAVAFPPDGHVAFKVGEVAPLFNKMGLWSLHQSFVMNKKVWDSMPADIQEAINSVSGRKGARWVTNMWYGHGYDQEWEAELERLKKEGFDPVVYTPAEQQIQTIREKGAMPVWNAWVKDMEKRGIDGKEILNYVLELAEKSQ